VTTKAQLLAFPIALAMSLGGCGTSNSASPSAKASSESAKSGPLTLDAFGLKADAPHASVQKGLNGTVLLAGSGPGDPTVIVEVASEKCPATLDDEKKKADLLSKAGDGGSNHWVGETLSDGYAATFDTKIGGSTTFMVKVRREIGGKA